MLRQLNHLVCQITEQGAEKLLEKIDTVVAVDASNWSAGGTLSIAGRETRKPRKAEDRDAAKAKKRREEGSQSRT
jgi:hypothetical protein